MEIITLPVGAFGANCYIVYDQEQKDALIIDPGDQGHDILASIKKHELNVKYIVNTHGHVDHIGANQEIKGKTDALLLIHELDAPMLTDPQQNMSVMFGRKIESPAADGYLKEGDLLEIGSLEFKVLHTPGHTSGGICLQGMGVVFSGDTLFELSIGRCDFPGGSYKQIIESIKNKLLVLEDSTIVYPGHGLPTTIGKERLENPFLR